MKKNLLLLILFFSLIKPTFSAHIAGGDFSVKWVGGNDFEVTLKLFRDCAGFGAAFDDPITVRVFENGTNAFQFDFSMDLNSIVPVTLGDECYSPPSTVCIQQGIYIETINLPDNVNGYYLTWERCCRNSTVQNISLPGDEGMVFYVQVPDPVLHNSTPVFGEYPSEGYLCIGLENTIDFDVTETDGDSLVYSLITPLAGVSTTLSTIPVPSPKPYAVINWQPPYNLGNIVGGAPPMSIDPNTGVITCYPGTTGVFTFAVMIEEYRGGNKISESIRDIQYYVLNCVIDDLPEIMLPDTITVSESSNACFDIVVADADATDTISILVTSPVTFADGATLTMPSPPVAFTPDTLYRFYFNNEITGLADSIDLPAPVDTGGAYYGIGAIGLHYCWATSCEDIDNSPFVLEVAAFSLGCSGDTNFINQTTQIVVVPIPLPEQEILLPDNLSVYAGDSTCFDIVVLSNDPADTVSILVNSPTLAAGATLTLPDPVSPGLYEFFYWNDSTAALDSVILPAATQVGSVYSTTSGGVGLHYCWNTSCEDILVSPFEVEVVSFGLACNGDTVSISESMQIDVVPPPFPTQDINLPPNFSVVADDEPCFDIVVLAEHADDTINVIITGIPDATLTLPTPVSPGLYEFFYWNDSTSAIDSVILPAATQTGSIYTGAGGVGVRFCWQTSCEDLVDSPFTVEVGSFIPGCNGDTSVVTSSVEITVLPEILPNQDIFLPDSITVVAREHACFDIVALSPDSTDYVSITVNSLSLVDGAALTNPTPVSTSPNMYEYHFWNTLIGAVDSVILPEPTYANGVYTGLGGVGLHYCWQPSCEAINELYYEIRVGAFRIGCYGDSLFKYNSAWIHVIPPDGETSFIPNVFTPNGDDINDEFKLGGIVNYCYDTVNIQIFNRWGQLVFESNDPYFIWDGTNKKGEAVSSGTYYVVLNGIYGDADITKHYPLQLFRD